MPTAGARRPTSRSARRPSPWAARWTPTSSSLPSVSVGIVSALDRIWGKAIQTDAKVSPTNYGGPLVDLQGRVQGVLVPASPQAEGETAGFEWYDSGIGFAIPLEDVYAVLPRLQAGQGPRNAACSASRMKGQRHVRRRPDDRQRGARTRPPRRPASRPATSSPRSTASRSRN